jgi:hypothetical protein
VNAAIARLLITEALAQLSAEHRAVVRRSYYLGWTTAQIADDPQITESIVTSRLHFAVRALRLPLQTRPTFSPVTMVEGEPTVADVAELAEGLYRVLTALILRAHRRDRSRLAIGDLTVA